MQLGAQEVEYYGSAIAGQAKQQEHVQQLQAAAGSGAQQQQPQHTSAFEAHAMQDLEPCTPEWTPPISGEEGGSSSLFAPLEEGPFSTDDSPLQRCVHGLHAP